MSMSRLVAVLFCLVLLVSARAVILGGPSRIEGVSAVEAPKFSGEVSNGFLNGSYGVQLWYVWLNTSGTHLLFLAMYSGALPSPINYFVGQHYFTTNGTEVFVGNRLLGFEVYEDLNGNSILDADFTNWFDRNLDETRYFFLLNASLTADFTPPSKSVVNSVTHYLWRIRYGQVQGNFAEIGNYSGGYIGDPETGGMFPSYFVGFVSSTLDSLSLSFDYWVENDTAYLKTGVSLGTFSKVEIPGPYPQPTALDFDDDSFSTLYTTSVLSMKPYEIKSENATNTGKAAVPVSATNIDVDNEEAFRLVFGENYTINGDSTEYKSSAGTYPASSVPGDVVASANYFTVDSENTFKDYFGETSPNLAQEITLGVGKSSLIYRVCYPAWSNRSLSHDPLFIAYLGEPDFINPSGNGANGGFGTIPVPLAWIMATAAASITLLAIAVYRHRKVRARLIRAFFSIPFPMFDSVKSCASVSFCLDSSMWLCMWKTLPSQRMVFREYSP